jgi:hypothetical protein
MRRFFSTLALVLSILALRVLGAGAPTHTPAKDPAALVQELYERYPHELEGGLPRGEDLDWLSTYISDRLYRQFRSTLEYQQDWIKRNPDHPPYYLKPPFADGVHFTGVPDAIDSFTIVDTRRQTPDFWEVRIHFCIGSGGDGSGWDALVMVRQQRSRYVIDDIIFLPAEPGDETWTLFDSLDWRDAD